MLPLSHSRAFNDIKSKHFSNALKSVCVCQLHTSICRWTIGRRQDPCLIIICKHVL